MVGLRVHFETETAHRLFNVDTYSAECRENLHGHTYKYDVEVTTKDGKLNSANMICDFKLLKETIKEFEKKYDHSVLIKEDDPLAPVLVKECRKVNVVKNNPTAEWMVSTFVDELNTLFDSKNLGIKVISLNIAETTGNVAFWRE